MENREHIRIGGEGTKEMKGQSKKERERVKLKEGIRKLREKKMNRNESD